VILPDNSGGGRWFSGLVNATCLEAAARTRYVGFMQSDRPVAADVLTRSSAGALYYVYRINPAGAG